MTIIHCLKAAAVPATDKHPTNISFIDDHAVR